MNKMLRIVFNLICFLSPASSTLGFNRNFVCNNSEIIDRQYFCDGMIDCQDGSDEILTSEECDNCTEQQLSCNSMDHFTNLTCAVQLNAFCNGTVACHGVTPCDLGCASHYRCANTSTCVPRATLCDGDSCSGCAEDADWTSGTGFKCVRNGRSCLLPQQLLYDDIKDCDNGDDLCFNKPGKVQRLDTTRCFKCLKGGIIIPRARVCNGIIDCPDLSDECLCQGNTLKICDDVITIARENSSCSIGQFSCGDGMCISRMSVCDGKRNCYNGKDEMFEFCGGTLLCSEGVVENVGQPCRCDKPCQSLYGKLCDGVGNCPAPGYGDAKWPDEPGHPIDECSSACYYLEELVFTCSVPYVQIGLPRYNFESLPCSYKIPTPLGFPEMVHYDVILGSRICDGIIDCLDLEEDEARERCQHRFYCKSGKLISIPKTKICDGYPDCDDLSDEINETCLDRFFCPVLGNTKISIERSYVCDFNINCDDGSDEMNCDDRERFYCEGGKPLFVSARQKFDGRCDCQDWSDECPTKSTPPDHDIFSSRYELIGNPILRAIVWIMGIIALFGNMCVIYGECQTLYRLMKKSEVSASLQTNHILVLSLAMADLIMGVYLIMLGTAGAIHSGAYCANKLAWLSSCTCATMGALVVISSQTSVFTMILLTSFRMYAVFKPFNSSIVPSLRLVLSLIFTSWTCSLFLGLLPFSSSLQAIFIEKAIFYDNPFFSNVIVALEEAKYFSQKLLLYDAKMVNNTDIHLKQLTSVDSWNNLQNVLSHGINHPEYIMTAQWLGYYSSNSVCIPKLFVTQDIEAWSFSFAVTLFNFLAFVFVSFGYVTIFIKSRTRASLQKTRTVKGQKVPKALQRKIIRLIVSDFFCWVPISIMAFMNIGGVKIPDIAYVISAVILLPINSALNPILYSSFMDRYMEKAWKRGSLLKSSLQTNQTTLSSGRKFSSTRV